MYERGSGQTGNVTHLSHCLRVHEAIIHSETIKTNNTVPGQMVINVFKTNLWKERGKRGNWINFPPDQEKGASPFFLPC